MTGSIAGWTARLTVTGRSRTNAFSSAAGAPSAMPLDEPLEHGLLAGPELAGDGLEGLGEPLGDVSIEQLERLDELSGDLGHTATLSHSRRMTVPLRGAAPGRESPPARPNEHTSEGEGCGAVVDGGRRRWRRCSPGRPGTSDARDAHRRRRSLALRAVGGLGLLAMAALRPRWPASPRRPRSPPLAAAPLLLGLLPARARPAGRAARGPCPRRAGRARAAAAAAPREERRAA